VLGSAILEDKEEEELVYIRDIASVELSACCRLSSFCC